MSIPQEDKEEIFAMFDAIFCHRAAELADNIEQDIRQCIIDLLLQLGPILKDNNVKAIESMLNGAVDHYTKEKHAYEVRMTAEREKKTVKGFGR